MRLSKVQMKKILKDLLIYVFTLLAFVVPPLLLLEPIELLQQNAFYIEWVGRVILVFYIIFPLFCILIALASSIWRSNIFIVISMTVMAFIYITFKYMNDSALFYLVPYVLIEGLIYFVTGRTKIRLIRKKNKK